MCIASGPFAGTSGYVPIGAFCAPHVPAVAAPSQMYGMAAQDGNVWGGQCQHCGEAPALHVLQSTQATRQAAVETSSLLATAVTGAAPKYNNDPIVATVKKGTPIMLGVLAVKDSPTLYVGHSGQKDSPFFAGVVSRFPGRVYARAIKVGVDDILNRRGELASNGSLVPALQRYDYQCAAPRIIQAALRAGHYPLAMTEIYHGGRAHAESILACVRCRNTVPWMLCPL